MSTFFEEMDACSELVDMLASWFSLALAHEIVWWVGPTVRSASAGFFSTAEIRAGTVAVSLIRGSGVSALEGF